MARNALALAPAALLLLLVGGLGGVEGGARPLLLAPALGALMLLALLGARSLGDPLRLGPAGRWLPAALVVTAAASWSVSPTPRAGIFGLLVLPAFLWLPSAVAGWLGSPEARRLAIVSWSLALAALAGITLYHDGLRAGSASAPFGDARLAGLVLAAALPVAALGWRYAGLPRVVSVAAVGATAVALATGDTLGGVLAAGAACAVAARRAGKSRDLLLGLALLSAAAVVPGLEATLRGEPSALRIRWNATRDLAAGAVERPWLGWGPGATAWIEAGLRRPATAGESVRVGFGSPSATPWLAAVDLGLPALLLAVAAAVAYVRARRILVGKSEDPGLALAGAASLAAGGVGLFEGSWLASPALPAMLGIAAGFQLAGEGGFPRRRTLRPATLLGVAYVAAAIWTARPFVVAAVRYEQARAESDAGRRARLLDEATRGDPAFPLYRARVAWGGPGHATAPPWRPLLEAAYEARGVAPFWLRAAERAARAGDRADALRAAHRALLLDPGSAAAPFLIHVLTSGDVDCAARAMLAEPRLAAALRWRGFERERRQVLARVAAWPGVGEAWKRRFLEQAAGATPRTAEAETLATRIDDAAPTAISVRIFRRTAWPADVIRWEVDGQAASRLRLPPAETSATDLSKAFPAASCAPSVPGGG